MILPLIIFVQCIIYSVHYKMYNVQYTLIVRCQLYTFIDFKEMFSYFSKIIYIPYFVMICRMQSLETISIYRNNIVYYDILYIYIYYVLYIL